MPPMPPGPPPAARAAGVLLLFGNLRDERFRGEEQGRDRRGVLERRAHDLHRVDDARGHEVLVLVRVRVVALFALRLFHARDDDGAFLARVGRDPAERLFDRLADEGHADALVPVELQRIERLAGADERHAAAGDDPLFHGRLGRVHRVLDARLLLLHLGFGGRPDLDDGDAADELRQPLLQLLAVVVLRGLFDLRADLLHTSLVVLLAAAIYVVPGFDLVDRTLPGISVGIVLVTL